MTHLCVEGFHAQSLPFYHQDMEHGMCPIVIQYDVIFIQKLYIILYKLLLVYYDIGIYNTVTISAAGD